MPMQCIRLIQIAVLKRGCKSLQCCIHLLGIYYRLRLTCPDLRLGYLKKVTEMSAEIVINM